MGCDIHFYVEQKRDGKWTAVGEFVKDEDGYMRGGESFYDGRNYNLFAILADVRNGRGFAGIKTGKGFNPISQPRGIPGNASAEYKEIADGWGCDGHSHSFLTLRELLDCDWTQTTQLQGWVNAVEWAAWSRWKRKSGEGPESYCGGVSGPDIKHLTPEEMDQLLAPVASVYGPEREKFAEQHKDTYALAVWQTPYYIAAGSFINETIPRLLKLAGGISGVDDVRTVFFFDN
jgi:hypothetical protein